ncbi:tetratricopeptide repeat protein [Actinoplanes sp. NPDC051859]|uniref:fibronectin type III domain-containing protein n=1 Tax=Actinoplanes sp. NPDC051859 TaxID=3363909 RepID=UPI0037900C71
MSQPSPLLIPRQRAQALAESGDVAQARALLEHVVRLGKADLGEDDPEVLATQQQLASLHRQAGDQSSTRRVLEEAYAAGQRRLGDADPIMLSISFDLGTIAAEMENRHEARRAFGRVAAHGPATLGPDHWAVTQARSYLGDDFPNGPPAPQPTPRLPHPPLSTRPPHLAPQNPTYSTFPTQPAAEIAQPHSASPGEPAAEAAQHAVRVPQQRAAFDGPAAPAPPAPKGSGKPAYSGRSPALFAAIAAVLGVIIAVAALVLVLARPGDDKSDESDVPTLSGPAPTDVQLRDDGSSVRLRWSDPANGRTSFLVTGGRRGEQLKPMGQVGPTTLSFDLNGLNTRLDYCFAVVAVYSSSQFASSPQVCTGRTESSGQPTRSGR